jgi:hypothetical protein
MTRFRITGICLVAVLAMCAFAAVASARGSLTLVAHGSEVPLKEGAELNLTSPSLVIKGLAGADAEIECTDTILTGALKSNGMANDLATITGLSFPLEGGKRSEQGTCADATVEASGLPWTATLTAKNTFTLKGAKKLAFVVTLPGEGVKCQYERPTVAGTFAHGGPVVVELASQIFTLARKVSGGTCSKTAGLDLSDLIGASSTGPPLNPFESSPYLDNAKGLFVNKAPLSDPVVYANNFAFGLLDGKQIFVAPTVGGVARMECENVFGTSPIPLGYFTTVTEQVAYTTCVVNGPLSISGPMPGFTLEEAFNANGELDFNHAPGKVVIKINDTCSVEFILDGIPATVELEFFTGEQGVNALGGFSGDHVHWFNGCEALNEPAPGPATAFAELPAHFVPESGAAPSGLFGWVAP